MLNTNITKGNKVKTTTINCGPNAVKTFRDFVKQNDAEGKRIVLLTYGKLGVPVLLARSNVSVGQAEKYLRIMSDEEKMNSGSVYWDCHDIHTGNNYGGIASAIPNGVVPTVVVHIVDNKAQGKVVRDAYEDQEVSLKRAPVCPPQPATAEQMTVYSKYLIEYAELIKKHGHLYAEIGRVA